MRRPAVLLDVDEVAGRDEGVEVDVRGVVVQQAHAGGSGGGVGHGDGRVVADVEGGREDWRDGRVSKRAADGYVGAGRRAGSAKRDSLGAVTK